VEGAAKAAPKESSVRHFPTPDTKKSAPGMRIPQACFRCGAEVRSKKQSPVKAKTKAGCDAKAGRARNRRECSRC